MVKRKDENPAVFIAHYLEAGLKKQTGAIIQVKTITIEASGPNGDVVFQFAHPFGKVKVIEKKPNRIIELETDEV